MSLKKFSGLVVLLVLIFCFATTITPHTAQAAATVKVGLLLPMTGPLASIGKENLNGYQMAVDEINEAGGIKALGGAKFELVIGDTEGKPDVGISQAERLINQEKVLALMGAWQSTVTMGTTQIAERYQIPHIIPAGAILAKITERGFKYTFRITPKDNVPPQTQLDALKWLNDNSPVKAKTLACLFENSDWGSSQARYWRKAAPDSGFKILVDEGHPFNATDLSSDLAKVKASGADVMMVANYVSDAILLLKTKQELKLNLLGYIASGGGESDPKFIETVGGEAAEGLISIDLFSYKIKNPKVQEVNARFKKKYGYNIAQYSSGTYSATWMLAHVLEKTGKADREAVRDALTKIDLNWANSNSIIPWNLKFDKDGQAPGTAILLQFSKGDWNIIYPASLATAKPIWPLPGYQPKK